MDPKSPIPVGCRTDEGEAGIEPLAHLPDVGCFSAVLTSLPISCRSACGSFLAHPIDRISNHVYVAGRVDFEKSHHTIVQSERRDFQPLDPLMYLRLPKC